MTKNRVAIYARVSTDEQSPESQLLELRAYCDQRGFTVVKEYVDIVSGNFESKSRNAKGGSKPASYNQLMKDAGKRRFDIVLVWKYDRFSRNLAVLMWALNQFSALGIDFISYTQNIDTTTATGKLFFQIIGSFAEFERETIVERIRSGLKRARAKGTRLGPPIKINREIIDRVVALHKQGLSYREIAKQANISIGTANKIVKQTLVY